MKVRDQLEIRPGTVLEISAAAGRLLARDRGFYQDYFTRLKVSGPGTGR